MDVVEAMETKDMSGPVIPLGKEPIEASEPTENLLLAISYFLCWHSQFKIDPNKFTHAQWLGRQGVGLKCKNKLYLERSLPIIMEKLKLERLYTP